MTKNVTLKIEINGRLVRVTYLNGKPWYAEVYVKPRNEMRINPAFTRTLWHRANGRPLSGLAKAAFMSAHTGVSNCD